MNIRPALDTNHSAIWSILEPVIQAGETYTLPHNSTAREALDYWFGPGHTVFVAENDDLQIVGTYYLRANQHGGGSHVANCGYVTAQWASGRGVARAMCAHSLAYARTHGYRAMQFNFVVSTNTRAVKLWQSAGFAIVGRLPEAFHHPTLGFVEALVMYRVI